MFRFGDPGGRIYGTAGGAAALWTTINNLSITVSSGHGRITGSALEFPNGWGCMTKTLNDNQSTLGASVALFFSAAQQGAQILQFWDGDTVQADIRINNDGS